MSQESWHVQDLTRELLYRYSISLELKIGMGVFLYLEFQGNRITIDYSDYGEGGVYQDTAPLRSLLGALPGLVLEADQEVVIDAVAPPVRYQRFQGHADVVDAKHPLLAPMQVLQPVLDEDSAAYVEKATQRWMEELAPAAEAVPGGRPVGRAPPEPEFCRGDRF